ncbi:unnamed protein product [Paramecium pentaurelia]|uniref:Uncharacterized protein n=1 Tax=Paramecium pentaurelia TaxID=43138 RepID=A0A8S1V3Z2_9CILI|nr:unnamed protein product [Paramecium pentaurelia]
MQNQKKTCKLQIQRQQQPIHLQNIVYQETNSESFCKLFQNNKFISTISKEVINKNKSIIARNKSLQLLNLILKHQSHKKVKKDNLNDMTIYNSLIIRQSLPVVKKITQPILSCREKKSYSVQQSRRYSNPKNQSIVSMLGTKIGPW